MGRSRSLIINSQFQPFSMQEMLQPVLMADQEHKNIEEAYTQLNAQASNLQQVLDEQRDSKAYELYQNYKKNLEESVDELSKRGLNTQSRRALNNVRTSFASDISPIQQAIERKGQLQEAQRQARERDDSLLFSKGAGEISIDDLMADPTISYDSVSGKSLESMAARAATSLTKEIRDRPTKWSSILGGQLYERIQKRGFRIEEVLEAVKGNPEASEVLRQIEKDVLDSSNIRSWNNQEATDTALRHIRMGLWQAVGQDDIDRVQNRGYSPGGEDPEYPPGPSEPSIYRGVPITGRGEGNYDDIMKEIDTLEEYLDFDFENDHYLESREDLKEEYEQFKQDMLRPGPQPINPRGGGFREFFKKGDPPKNPEEHKQDRIITHLESLGVRNKEDLIRVIKDKYNEASKTAVRNQTYVLNLDNLKTAQDKINTSLGIQGLKTVYNYENGKREGKASASQVTQLLKDKDYNIFYDPKYGIGITGTSGKGIKSFILDDESLTNITVNDNATGRPKNILTAQREAALQQIEAGDMNGAKETIDYIMNFIAASQTDVYETKEYIKNK